VATISRLFKIIGLFCKRALQKRLHSAKETYNFEEPTNRSHPIYRNYILSYRRTSCKTPPMKIIGLFCKRALQKRPYSAKETYNFKQPTNRSHMSLDPSSKETYSQGTGRTCSVSIQRDTCCSRSCSHKMTVQAACVRVKETYLPHTWRTCSVSIRRHVL